MELVIGVAVASFLGAAAWKVLRFFHRENLVQQRIATGQNEIFPIQKALEKNIRRASYGIPLVSRMRDSTGAGRSVAALSLSENPSGPDGLVILGNFSDVRAQLRDAFPLSSSTMSLQSGTADGFSVGDWVVLDMGQYSEHVRINSVNSTPAALGVGSRIYAYPAGTNIMKLSRVEFKADSTSLSLIQEGRTHVLTRNLDDLHFYLHSYDGSVDSVAPYSMGEVKAVSYRVRVRIRRPGNAGYLFREAEAQVLLRNIPL